MPPPAVDPLEAAFNAFAAWRGDRYAHFRDIARRVAPQHLWNSWDEWTLREFCDESNWQIQDSTRFLNMANVGCASAGKTHRWSFFGFFWFWADPANSALIITSITKSMIRARSWRVIQDYYNMLGDPKPGHMLDSRTTLQNVKGDDKHAIFAQAVGQGETGKAVQRIAGHHVPRIMLVVDEAPGTPEAVFHVINNLRKGCKEFVLVTIGNAIGRLNAHGRICEPEDGWTSVDEDTGLWRTRGVPEWQIPPGVCLHYHGKRSPNVIAGKNAHPYLYRIEDWTHAEKRRNQLYYWVYDAGFYPPEGISNTVFDEAILTAAQAYDRFRWHSTKEVIGALDPAFGGDNCCLRFAEMGDLEDGRRAILATHRVPIQLLHGVDRPADFQIADQAISACKALGCKPECFAVDATGIGRGVAAIMAVNWSPNIVRVEFGGRPTDTVDENGVKGPDAYDRRVTQLWWSCREVLVCGQLRGIDNDTARQFCNRTYAYAARQKVKIETKEETKARIGRSPDDADAIAMIVEVARQRGLVPHRPGAPPPSVARFARAAEMDEVYAPEDPTPALTPAGAFAESAEFYTTASD